MRALIITHSGDDESVARVSHALQARGARAFRFDTDRFPCDHSITARLCGHDARIVLARAGDTVEVGELAGAWQRRLDVGAALPRTMDARLRDASIQSARRALRDAVASLPCFVLDPVERVWHADHTQLQLRVARHIGLDTPRTLTTNSPEALRAFRDECHGSVVSDARVVSVLDEEAHARFAVAQRGAGEELADPALVPRTFQEHVPASVALRVTIVGERVFTAASRGADLRGAAPARLATWQPHVLPHDVEAGFVKLLDVFALNYAAIDAAVTDDGRYVFLGLDPLGDFAWLERGGPQFPISDAIADVTIGLAFRRENALTSHGAACC